MVLGFRRCAAETEAVARRRSKSEMTVVSLGAVPSLQVETTVKLQGFSAEVTDRNS